MDPSPRDNPGLNRFGCNWVSSKAVLRGRLCVLSPHLDDAAFSVGAALAGASHAGTEVQVVSVFAGDPESAAAPSWWDERAGFASLGQAADARRREDARACRLLGATPVWLSFPDEAYTREIGDDEVWTTLAPYLDGAALVLVPGFPLMHDDHVRICRLARAHVERERIAYYVEQPYGAWLRSGLSQRRPNDEEIKRLDGTWHRVRSGPAHWAAKWRAMRAYKSQLRPLKGPVARIMAYELVRGGETIALPR